jgi:hypothetical protein
VLVLRGRVPVLGLVDRRLRAKNVSCGFQRFLQYLEWLAVCHCAIESRWTASLGSVLLKEVYRSIAEFQDFGDLPPSDF